MALRRLAEHQPESFAFTPENAAWCRQQMTKYPPGRQASAVIPILWRAQEQEGWVTRPMIEEVGRMLGMPYMRVLEVATFYTMFNLHPWESIWFRSARQRRAGCVVRTTLLPRAKSIFIRSRAQFPRTALFLDGNGMSRRLR